MAVKLRLRRMGKKKQPTYRVVVADARAPRDGRIIESIGRYDPRQEPSLVEIDMDRARYWLGTGAIPTERVQKLLEITGAVEAPKVSRSGVYRLDDPPAPPPADTVDEDTVDQPETADEETSDTETVATETADTETVATETAEAETVDTETDSPETPAAETVDSAPEEEESVSEAAESVEEAEVTEKEGEESS